jgi:hypothetical protein
MSRIIADAEDLLTHESYLCDTRLVSHTSPAHYIPSVICEH